MSNSTLGDDRMLTMMSNSMVSPQRGHSLTLDNHLNQVGLQKNTQQKLSLDLSMCPSADTSNVLKTELLTPQSTASISPHYYPGYPDSSSYTATSPSAQATEQTHIEGAEFPSPGTSKGCPISQLNLLASNPYQSCSNSTTATTTSSSSKDNQNLDINTTCPVADILSTAGGIERQFSDSAISVTSSVDKPPISSDAAQQTKPSSDGKRKYKKHKDKDGSGSSGDGE